MTVILSALKDVIDSKQKQLSVGHINGSALQRITEDQKFLFTTPDYLEQQRHAEQKMQL